MAVIKLSSKNKLLMMKKQLEEEEKQRDIKMKAENKVLNELYDTSTYANKAMIERYTDYLYNVLKSTWDPFIRNKHTTW